MAEGLHVILCTSMPKRIRKGASPSRAAIYLGNFLVSFHYFLVVFVTSTYLIRYVDTQRLSLLYVLGSALSVVLFAYFATLVQRFGNYRLTLWFVVLEIAALLGLGFGHDARVIIPSFLLYLAISPALYLNLDIFLEKSISDEHTTGGVRGLFLSMQNITQIVCPLLAGFLLANNEYWRVFLVSAVFLLIVLVVLAGYLRHFSDSHYHPRTLWQSAAYVFRHPMLYHAVAAQFLLRFFYAWMVIYTPLYLFQYLGFSWQQIGIMFAIMLVPFLLLELPLGRLADRRLGEKEIMTLGFILMAGTVAYIPFLTAPSFVLWSVVLFVSRIGAACTEIATESYFFKHVDGSLADTISLFRVSRPVTYIAAAAVATLTLEFLPLRWSFLVLALVMLWGLRYALTLKDTR